MPEQLQVGFGRTDISPKLGTRLAGYGVKDRPAESIHDPLHASTLVFQQGDRKAAIVSLPWTAVETEEVETIRRLVGEKTGLVGCNITVHVYHSHTSPCTFRCDGWGGKEKEYLDFVMPKIIESVVLAERNLEPAKVGIGTISTETGANRRSVTIENRTSFAADPNGQYDDMMTVIRFEGHAGPIAALIHCGAHPTAWGPERVVSRDWPGVMIDRVSQQVKSPVMFVNGAFGDVGPRMNIVIAKDLLSGSCLFSAGVGDGWSAVQEVGYRAASDALRAHQSIKQWYGNLELKMLTEDITFPCKPLPSLEEAKARQKELEPTRDTWGQPMADYCYWTRVIEAHSQPEVTEELYQQTITCLGPIAFVPVPGEVFSDISLRLRRYSPFAHTLVLGCSNGSNGYFVSRESRHRGGYEPWVQQAIRTHLLCDEIDDVLVEENLRLLKKVNE